MAKINFDTEAYSYAEGIKAVRLMFEAAKTTINLHSNEVIGLIAEYEKHLENGGDPIGDWEDENRLWDQHDIYRLQLMAFDEALVELRIATVISLYHLWERHIPNPSGDQRTHRELIRDAQTAAINLHSDFKALHYAANYFKHGSDHWRTKLNSEFPDRFPVPVGPNLGWSAAFRQVHLKDTDIDWFMEIAVFSERQILQT